MNTVVNGFHRQGAKDAKDGKDGYGKATDCASLNRYPASVVRRTWRPWRLGGEEPLAEEK